MIRGSFNRGRYLASILCSKFEPQVGGRLALFPYVWSSLSSEPRIDSTVESGLQLEFVSIPIQESIPAEIVMDIEVSDLLTKAAITQINFGPTFIIFQSFLNGRLRQAKCYGQTIST